MKSLLRLSILTLVLLLALVTGAAQPPASQIMDDALARAKSDNKAVFLVFGGPGCVWCKILDKFLEAPEIKPIFSKYFVTAHLQLGEDPSSNPGAADVHAKYKAVGGVPYHLFLQPDGTAIIDSKENGTRSNIGYPAAPNEIKWFLTMLEKAAPKMTAEERATIETKLKSFKKG